MKHQTEQAILGLLKPIIEKEIGELELSNKILLENNLKLKKEMEELKHIDDIVKKQQSFIENLKNLIDLFISDETLTVEEFEDGDTFCDEYGNGGGYRIRGYKATYGNGKENKLFIFDEESF